MLVLDYTYQKIPVFYFARFVKKFDSCCKTQMYEQSTPKSESMERWKANYIVFISDYLTTFQLANLAYSYSL